VEQRAHRGGGGGPGDPLQEDVTIVAPMRVLFWKKWARTRVRQCADLSASGAAVTVTFELIQSVRAPNGSAATAHWGTGGGGTVKRLRKWRGACGRGRRLGRFALQRLVCFQHGEGDIQQWQRPRGQSCGQPFGLSSPPPHVGSKQQTQSLSLKHAPSTLNFIYCNPRT
jgi:hypothetical protein